MIIKKAFRYRLCPSKRQLHGCVSFVEACRWVYNRGLAVRNKAWEENKRSISLFDQNKELSILKYEEETKWLKEIHSQILAALNLKAVGTTGLKACGTALIRGNDETGIFRL